jgi:predicted phage-related endonuclease
VSAALELINPRSREEWLGLRKGRMTSSLVAAALGMDEHKTPLEAWLAITGRDDFDGNKATLRGSLLESPVLDYPTRGGHLRRRPASFVRHSNGWSADSADCVYIGDGGRFVGEGKTVAGGGADAWGAEGTDEIPERVIVQCCWHMAHWPETQGAIVPVLVGGWTFEFREYHVARDADLIGEIMESAERFHRDHVVTDLPPPATAHDDGALKYLWPKHVPEKFVPASAKLEELTRVYVAARDELKAAEEKKKTAGMQLRQLLGDAEGSIGRGWKVTHKWQPGGLVTDWKAMAEHLGADEALEQQFTREAPGHRVLRATLPAPKKPTQKKERAK